MKHFKPTDYWETPLEVFQWAEKRFGKFDIDVAANWRNTKCEQFISETDDALRTPWGGRCWLNPPYSNVAPWLEKAHISAKAGAEVIVLLKYDHSTKWWRDYICPNEGSLLPYPNVELIPYPKRIKFGVPPELDLKATTAPWPSLFVRIVA